MDKKSMIEALKKTTPFRVYGHGLTKRSKEEIQKIYDMAIKVGAISEFCKHVWVQNDDHSCSTDSRIRCVHCGIVTSSGVA